MVKENYNEEKLVKIYMKDVLRLHGIPNSIILNKDKHFTSMFWNKLHEDLGTKLDLSATFYPQTNWQFGRTIQILEDIPRACTIDFGGYWG